MDVIELAVNVIIIQILESEETTFYGCNRTSCKRYYNLKSEETIFLDNSFWM